MNASYSIQHKLPNTNVEGNDVNSTNKYVLKNSDFLKMLKKQEDDWRDVLIHSRGIDNYFIQSYLAFQLMELVVKRVYATIYNLKDFNITVKLNGVDECFVKHYRHKYDQICNDLLPDLANYNKRLIEDIIETTNELKDILNLKQVCKYMDLRYGYDFIGNIIKPKIANKNIERFNQIINDVIEIGAL